METKIDIAGVVLETERLLLRPFQDSDLDDFFTYASVPGVGEMAGWAHHRTREDSRTVLSRFMEERDVFAIVHKRDGKVIGSVGVHDSWAAQDAQYSGLRIKDLGFVLSKDYWGQGLMPEAARIVIDYCFRELGLDALTCGHFVENTRSQRVIEKLGFHYVKTLKLHARTLGKTFDTKCYILFKTSTSRVDREPAQR